MFDFYSSKLFDIPKSIHFSGIRNQVQNLVTVSYAIDYWMGICEYFSNFVLTL